jgi:hypothetical protein
MTFKATALALGGHWQEDRRCLCQHPGPHNAAATGTGSSVAAASGTGSSPGPLMPTVTVPSLTGSRASGRPAKLSGPPNYSGQ